MTTTTIKTNSKATAIKTAVTEIMSTLSDFSAILNDETAALKRSDFETVDRLQPAKRNMATQYQAMVTALAARHDEMQQLDVDMREKLIRARTKFTLTLNDNMRVLELVKRSTQRLSNRILEVARLSVVDQQQTHYSAKGHTQSYKSSTLSLSIDQSL